MPALTISPHEISYSNGAGDTGTIFISGTAVRRPVLGNYIINGVAHPQGADNSTAPVQEASIDYTEGMPLVEKVLVDQIAELQLRFDQYVQQVTTRDMAQLAQIEELRELVSLQQLKLSDVDYYRAHTVHKALKTRASEEQALAKEYRVKANALALENDGLKQELTLLRKQLHLPPPGSRVDAELGVLEID